MSDKFCCTTWTELSLELAAAKEAELNALIADKGLPRSMFAGLFRTIAGMTNYCPLCGTVLNPELQPKLKELHKTALKEVAAQTDETPSYTIEKKKCQACAGRGILGTDKNKVEIRCMRCHGQGWFEAKNIAVDPRAKQGLAKVDAVREQKGIGDEPVSIDAKGEIE